MKKTLPTGRVFLPYKQNPYKMSAIMVGLWWAYGSFMVDLHLRKK